MTKKEAIEKIDDVLSSEYNYDETLGYQLTSDDFEWLEQAKQSLEKQIPKKPIQKSIGGLKFPDTAFCPICDSAVIKDEADNYEQAYCCYCGQALDWSDEK